MKSPNSHYSDVLMFWRAVEAFNLPAVPEPEINKKKVFTILTSDNIMPWEDEYLEDCPPGYKWKHTVYFSCLPKMEVIQTLGYHLDKSVQYFPEPIAGTTCLSALVLDQYGCLLDKTYIRSSFAYGIKALVDKTSLKDLNEDLKKAHADFLLRFQINVDNREEIEEEGEYEDEEDDEDEEEYEDEEEDTDEELTTEDDIYDGTPFSWTELEKEVDDLQACFPFLPQENAFLTCISEQIHSSGSPEAPFLNSFYTNDLNRILEDVTQHKNISPSLSAYLKKEINPDLRIDMQEKAVMLQCLNPGYQSAARWPSNPAHGLYSAQLSAINVGLYQLRQGMGLIGVNGPPGTGKTTLLREVIADVVVSRAKRLLNCNIHKIFTPRWNQIAGPTGYYEIHKEIFGNDGILVASNNNNAVKNISAELPLKKNIDTDTFPDEDAHYFSRIANKILPNTECWAMLSAVLGNAANRNSFTSNFWFNNSFGEYLSGEYKGNHEKQHQEDFEEASLQLRQLLKEYEEFQKIATEYHEITQCLLWPKLFKGKVSEKKHKELKNILSVKYGISEQHLIDEHYKDLTIEDIHKLNPYSSPYLNKLRSDIFLRSLSLHACAININAKYFRSNLDTFLNMLAGKHISLISEDISLQLWNTFFFCVPVVSSTLASVETLFSKMGSNSLGWLLLDEAGQATPQSSCGAIWRSKHCIIIGDTMQIPPVVTMPEELGKMLQQKTALKDDCWSPHYYSTQSLADRVTNIGTYIHLNNDEIWTGFPLRAHRRCDEPMFSIANHIAYDNQMVKVTEDTVFDVCLGKSRWIHVNGNRNRGHLIEEEIDKLKILLKELYDAGYRKTIFIISPFKSVADECTQLFSTKYKFIVCGTIHAFQGKETEIVFIILGSDPKKHRAREWVAQSPNMLNVAVTRAKKRIYVIGNVRLWSKQKYFSYLITTKLRPIQ